jgi:hypothetical protein
MNGCELPCRSVLQVQPASSKHKKEQPPKQPPEQPFAHDPVTMQGSLGSFLRESFPPNPSSADDNEKKQAQEATEDLDDFFASL